MILVTGAAGHVGNTICRAFLAAGKPVRAMVRNRVHAEQEGRLRGLNAEWVEGDVTRPDTLARAMQGVEEVIHTVAIAVEKGQRTYEKVNYEGTLHVIEAAKAAGVRRFINISQLGADANLPYRFLASKGRAQEAVAASGLEWTAFRPSVIWGPEDEFANSFARLVPLTPFIFPIIGGREARFQPVWVEDVAACVLKAVDDAHTIGKEYELGGPEILTLEDIERRTLRAIGRKRWMIPFPMGLLRLVAGMMEALLPAPPVTRSLLDLLAVSNVTRNNAIGQFVDAPRRFSEEAISGYMRKFRAGDTLKQFLGK